MGAPAPTPREGAAPPTRTVPHGTLPGRYLRRGNSVCACVCAHACLCVYACLCVFMRGWSQPADRRVNAGPPPRPRRAVRSEWTGSGGASGAPCAVRLTRGEQACTVRAPASPRAPLSPCPRRPGRRGALRVFPAPRPRWARSGRSACGTTAAGPRPPGTSAAWWWESCPRAQGGAGSSPPSAGWPRTGRTAVWRGSSPACAGASASGR